MPVGSRSGSGRTEEVQARHAFRDRAEAGRALADLLAAYHGRADAIVLGLPRGGVPVAAEVATGLRLPLDVFLVRKLGVPGQEELAMGAIADGDVRILNQHVIDGLRLSRADVERVTAVERAELARREARYRAGRPPLEVAGRAVIVVDDGLATGSTMRAAVVALRELGPTRIVVAVPVGAAHTCAELAQWADEVVCARQPHHFRAVGEWYRDFRPTSDDEIGRLLRLTAPPPTSGIGGMDLIAFYERALASTAKVVAGVRDDQLGAPTPCAAWDVRVLGNHIIGGTWRFAAAVGGLAAPAANGADQVDYMAGDRAAAIAEAAVASLAAFRRPGVLDDPVELPMGSVPGHAALAYALLDVVVHGWDLAKATGQNTAIPVDLAGATFEVAKAMVGDDLRALGVFAPPVAIGDDAPVHERLVAFLGRQP